MEEIRNNNFNKVMMVIVAVVLVLNLAFTCFMFGKQVENSKSIQHINKEMTEKTKNTETRYNLYIGTNDKDTGQQKYPIEQCRQIVTDICKKYSSGCTLLDATGYWTDESGESGTEQTIECVLDGITKDKAYQIADECIKQLNQSTVLIETNEVDSEFYSGK